MSPDVPLTADASLAELSTVLRSGERSLDGYLATARERADAVEPAVASLVPEDDRWRRLERDAGALRDRAPEPGSRHPLYGGLVGVKDIFRVRGLPTRAGSSVPPAELAGPEASTVTALVDAGALILGKTVTTEFAFIDPGPTRNPHDLDHTPGGSSSGSAAAVAAGLCPLALGTQTVGSVIRPAAFCGVVGVKPSYGRVPTAGVLPLAPSVDHVGWFTQDVPSARLAAGVLAPDWRPVQRPSDPRLGAVDGPYLDQADDVAKEQFERQVAALDGAGDPATRLRAFDDIDAVNQRHRRLVAAETALSHAEWYPTYGDRYGPELRALIEEGREVPDGELARARAGRTELREAVETSMDEAGVDLLLSPSAPGPAPEGLDSTGDPVMNLPWTHSGLPTVSLPAGTVDGLPVGLQVAARHGSDEQLLAWVESLAAVLGR